MYNLCIVNWHTSKIVFCCWLQCQEFVVLLLVYEMSNKSHLYAHVQSFPYLTGACPGKYIYSRRFIIISMLILKDHVLTDFLTVKTMGNQSALILNMLDGWKTTVLRHATNAVSITIWLQSWMTSQNSLNKIKHWINIGI